MIFDYNDEQSRVPVRGTLQPPRFLALASR